MAAWSRIAGSAARAARALRGSAAATSSMTAGEMAIVASLAIITSGSVLTYTAWQVTNQLRDCLKGIVSEQKAFLRNLESQNSEFLQSLRALMEKQNALLGGIRVREASEEEEDEAGSIEDV
uniref:Uncharacterized protein n=1 Tax=Leersia perrieri TaxID=77586 RepID=A0A0D9WKC4_9ORYZ